MTRALKSRGSLLFTSAGRRVELIECFRAGALQLGLDLRILACDLAPQVSAACARADEAFEVPSADDPEYARSITAIAENRGTLLIVPTIDPELNPLACAAQNLASKEIRVHVSAPDTIGIVRDKARTAKVLDAAGVPVPRTVALDDLRASPDLLFWPVFLKPASGSASRGLSIIEHPADLPQHSKEPMVAQELLKGPEYTINIFIDAVGRLRTAIPHLRLAVRAGEVEKGRTERRSDLRDIAEGITAALPGLRGAACFQVIDDPARGPRVIEINARFGGGYPLADEAGATFARWLLEEVTTGACSAHDDWAEGVEMLRYDAAVFRRPA
jgi:carbamoyl-phosphate synthase large subunit